KFPTFNESVTDPSDSQSMDVDSSASSHSLYGVIHPSVVGQTESPIREVNDLLPQSGRSAQGKVCYVCNRTFRRVNQLKRHQKRMHSTTGKFKCPECPSTFDK